MTDSPLVGAWRLVTVEDHHPDGRVTYPYGEHSIGYLIYHPDGYMSATLMAADRAPLAHPARPYALAAEDAAAVMRTMGSAYCGTYEVRDGSVVHHVQASLVPNMTGSDEVRPFELIDDRLYVYTMPRPGGDGVKICAIWQRAEPTRDVMA
jgi:Lipocalin-like domain